MSRQFESLREILLEKTVVNFDEIFFDDTREVKKHICLPPRMFEDIQSKSTQICWPIPHEYLKVCLSHREALNWVNIDLAKVDLLEKDFLNIDKSNFPIKQLSFTTDYVTPAMMETVGRFASTIEILEVDFEPTGFLDYSEIAPKQNLIQFPKLGRLLMNLSIVPVGVLHRIDMMSCSKSLKQLILTDPYASCSYNIPIITEFIKSFKCLQSLEALNISHGRDNIPILDVLSHLRNLRTLEIFNVDGSELKCISLAETLPHLRHLSLPYESLKEVLPSLKEKKLDYLGAIVYTAIPESEKRMARKFGSFFDLEGRMNFLENSPLSWLQNTCLPAICRYGIIEDVFHRPNLMTTRNWRRLEKIFLYIPWEIFQTNFIIPVSDVISINESKLSESFVRYYVNLVVNSAAWRDIHVETIYLIYYENMDLMKSRRMTNFMIFYVTSSPNNPISRMYLRYLVTRLLVQSDHTTLSWIINHFEITSVDYRTIS